MRPSLAGVIEADITIDAHAHQQAKPSITVNIAVPPKEISGNGTPTIGIRPATIAALINT